MISESQIFKLKEEIRYQRIESEKTLKMLELESA